MAERPLFAIPIAALILAAACTESRTPTGPSRTAAPTESAAATSSLSSWAPVSQRGLVVDWACFATTYGCPFIQPAFDFGQDLPGAPSNLAFQVSGTTVILTWSPPGAGGAVVSYIVEAGTGPGLTNIASFNTGSTATTLTVTSVPAGAYVVRVRARNADGTSAASNEVTVVVSTGPCPPPSAPAGLTASVNGSTVQLQWNVFTGAISYVIEAGSSSGASNIIVFETGSAATSFSGSAPPGTYFIRVRGRTACGISGVSNEVVVTVGGGGGINLSGTWAGTVAITMRGVTHTENVNFNFQHAGSRLTGDGRSLSPGGGLVALDLTESASTATTRTFAGMLRFVNAEGPCSPAAIPGSLVANTASLTMNGSFSGRNMDCIEESSSLTLQRVSGEGGLFAMPSPR